MQKSAPRRGSLILVSLGLLRVVATAHGLAVFAQPVFAGAYLSGQYDRLALHALGADLVSYLGYGQLVITIVLLIIGGPRWPLPATLLVVAAETGQYVAGLAGALDLHVPLGVAIVAGNVVLVINLWRPQTRGVSVSQPLSGPEPAPGEAARGSAADGIAR
ncbi:hypothetical protein [Microlunatus sp. GCM10028923]|uniref:hypothetical protein n=1 Tax=Microlunatus sp. GCM10028923 TaxID=3273400 RepID=UPI003611C1C4